MKQTLLFSKQLFRNAFRQKAFYWLWLLFMLLLIYAGYTGQQHVASQNEVRQHYQQVIRKSWTDNPDKHPHRMAHYGSFALRLQHPMSLFDFGMENYAGNAVFLEAHKQNTVNYSEASFSTGLLRMGELNMAMLLQNILPLILVFLGFGCVAGERENGTLKMISSQGGSNFSLLMGRSLGLWLLSGLFLIPAFILTGILLAVTPSVMDASQIAGRMAIVFLCYLFFFWIISVSTIIVSATSINSKGALMKLLGLWLLFAMVLPKVVPVLGAGLFPAPSKLQFQTAVEQDILKQGDSHNPNDPFFNKLRDSVLKKYRVRSVQQLPFNYGGLVGRTGEQLSADTYVKHQDRLLNLYRKQNTFSQLFEWVNPFVMIRNNSMAFCGSDFEAYSSFQQQAEAYRYALAQRMNELQMKYVGNVNPKEGSHLLHIDKKHWEAFPDFHYRFLTTGEVTQTGWPSLVALGFWLLVSFLLLRFFSKRFKIIF